MGRHSESYGLLTENINGKNGNSGCTRRTIVQNQKIWKQANKVI